ncbi:MAG: putative DNA modification/repair radical SAM protein [Anaerolineae bacterium]|nr:putative DNA modification/repair radical SAM protein [Anaerolineae bacterium]
MGIAIRVAPDASEKVEILGRAAQYDVCGEACGSEANRTRDNLGKWIYPAVMPDGKRIALLKVLQTNVCEKNCAYCANRVGRDVPRNRFSPDELARVFDQMAQRKLVEGLFLSSGICGSAQRSMDHMIATVELVRERYGFQGYVHLKLLPGATRDQVERAGQIAQRVSVNLEAPNMQRLGQIAPNKGRDEVLNPMRWASEFIRAGGGRWAPAGQTTQFVVGAADESDRELLTTAHHLYTHLDLHRAYFSAFQPVRGTPLEGKAHTPAWREHRLYQCDFLFRMYGFALDELVFDQEGLLPREADPKMMWARAHPECFPIEVNRAAREDLLRVPGIGPRSAARIVSARRSARLTALSDLHKLGAVPARAAPYVLLAGRRPPFQLALC